MTEKKDRILKYFEEQLAIKEQSLIRHEAGMNNDQNQIRCLMLRREIAELEGHVVVIQML